jgi:hypothetical protein
MLGCYLYNKITFGFGLSNNFKIKKPLVLVFQKIQTKNVCYCFFQKLHTTNKIYELTKKFIYIIKGYLINS